MDTGIREWGAGLPPRDGSLVPGHIGLSSPLPQPGTGCPPALDHSLRSLQPEVCAGPVPAFSFSALAGSEEQSGQGQQTGSLEEGTGEGRHSRSPPQPHFSSFTWFPASGGGWEQRGPVNEVGKGSLQRGKLSSCEADGSALSPAGGWGWEDTAPALPQPHLGVTQNWPELPCRI